MRVVLGAVLLFAAARVTVTQRPSDTTICDYYATVRYGANNGTTQFRLMESIVALAFGGANGLSGASSDSTGILNPGTFEGQPVNLRSWFDGSKATTNLNNQPVGINWLDAGAQEPLAAFLNGSTDSVVISNTTNEFRLFVHFFSAFGNIFGCSLVKGFPKTNESGGFISLAYVHKYMNLNQTDLGYFIDQLITSSKYFGFSDQDADTLSGSMNSKYNVRCAPPVNGQLYSLCQATECPLAAPSPDCADYANLGPSGIGNSTGPSSTGGSSSPTSTGSSSTSSASTTPGAAASTTSSSELSSGAIAGISIGSAAVAFIALGVLLYMRRRPSSPQIIAVPYSGPGYASPSNTNPHASYLSSAPHHSYIAPAAGQGYYVPKPPSESGTGPVGYNVGERATSPQQPQNVPMRIAEMESPSNPPIRDSIPPMEYVDPSLIGNQGHIPPVAHSAGYGQDQQGHYHS